MDLESPASPDLTTREIEEKQVRLAASIKKQRWGILAVGLAGSAVLIIDLLGYIPGAQNIRGLAGSIGLAVGAAFVGAAGVIGCWLWSRFADTRSKRVRLTESGVETEFVGGSTARFAWADPDLRLTVRECSDPTVFPDASVVWGTGRLGQVATISRAGAERLRAEASSRGLRGTTTTEGKPPYVWTTTKFIRG